MLAQEQNVKIRNSCVSGHMPGQEKICCWCIQADMRTTVTGDWNNKPTVQQLEKFNFSQPVGSYSNWFFNILSSFDEPYNRFEVLANLSILKRRFGVDIEEESRDLEKLAYYTPERCLAASKEEILAAISPERLYKLLEKNGKGVYRAI